jgi:DinB superfamily
VATATEVLSDQWAASCERLGRITDGLTDAEFLWEPCAGCWSVRPDPSAPGGWVMDYPERPSDPPPVTTIAWRLLHVAHGNWVYWEHAFGPGRRTFLDLPTHGSAATAVADLVASQALVTATLAAMTDAALDEPRPTHFGVPWRARDVLATLLDEQVHHGAEVSLLRDLFRNRASLGGH